MWNYPLGTAHTKIITVRLLSPMSMQLIVAERLTWHSSFFDFENADDVFGRIGRSGFAKQ